MTHMEPPVPVTRMNDIGVTITPLSKSELAITKRFIDEFGAVIVAGFPTPDDPLPLPDPFMPGRPVRKKPHGYNQPGPTDTSTSQGALL